MMKLIKNVWILDDHLHETSNCKPKNAKSVIINENVKRKYIFSNNKEF